MQRILGHVDGSPAWPALVLSLLVAAAFMAMKRIDRWLMALGQ
jgi:hypothetical protein